MAYMVLPFVVIRIENERREILLGRHPQEERKAYPGFWDLPAGKLESNEELEECCSRELYEETGFSVVSMRLLGGYHHSKDKFAKGFTGTLPGLAFCYELAVEGEFKPAEMDDMQWITVEELQELKDNLTPWTEHFLRDIIYD